MVTRIRADAPWLTPHPGVDAEERQLTGGGGSDGAGLPLPIVAIAREIDPHFGTDPTSGVLRELRVVEDDIAAACGGGIDHPLARVGDEIVIRFLRPPQQVEHLP